MLGCLIVEVFSQTRIWDGYSDGEILSQLKMKQIPKLPTSIPHQKWGIICECLNPFYESRINILDAIIRLCHLLIKLGFHDIVSRLESIL